MVEMEYQVKVEGYFIIPIEEMDEEIAKGRVKERIISKLGGQFTIESIQVIEE